MVEPAAVGRGARGAPPAPQFDTVDIAVVEQAALRGRGPCATIVAALRQPQVTGFGRPGADLVVLGGGAFGRAPEGWVARPEGAALAVAYGAAASRRARRPGRAVGDGVWVWCLLRPSAWDDGRTWEAARAVAAAGLDTLTVVVAADPAGVDGVRAVMEAAGFKTLRFDGHDPWAVVGAIDKARAAAGIPLGLIAETARR